MEQPDSSPRLPPPPIQEVGNALEAVCFPPLLPVFINLAGMEGVPPEEVSYCREWGAPQEICVLGGEVKVQGRRAAHLCTKDSL